MKQLILFFIIILLTGSSCTKNNVSPDKADTSKKLVQVKNAMWSDTKQLSYTTSGLLKAVQGPYETITHTEGGDGYAVVMVNKVTSKKIWEWVNGIKDAAGRVIRITLHGFKDDGSVSKTYTDDFTYTAEGYLKTWLRAAPGYTDRVDFEWENGNLLRYTEYENNVKRNSYVFEYFADLQNRMRVDFFEFMGLGNPVDQRFGSFSKNMVKTMRVLNAQQTETTREDYTYTLDNEGYPVTATVSYPANPGNPSTYQFSFE